jgi:hypothetical protein
MFVSTGEKTVLMCKLTPEVRHIANALSSWHVHAADTSIPSELRKTAFTCDQQTNQAALAIKRSGWTYVMPEPKSKRSTPLGLITLQS